MTDFRCCIAYNFSISSLSIHIKIVRSYTSKKLGSYVWVIYNKNIKIIKGQIPDNKSLEKDLGIELI